MWAAFQRFHLIDPAVALALMLLVTAWNAYMAWVQDSELLPRTRCRRIRHAAAALYRRQSREFSVPLPAGDRPGDGRIGRLRAWPRLLLGAFR